jgi:hypothetical protein
MKRRNAVSAVLSVILGCGGGTDPRDGPSRNSTRYAEDASFPNPQCTMPSTWDPAIGQPSAAALQQLAPTGTLRVAVYYGNQTIGVCTPSSGKGCTPAFDPQLGVLSGTAVDLACRLQAQLKIPLTLTGYPTIAALNDGFPAGTWEIGFGSDPDLLVVPGSIGSHPYIGNDNTFLVPADSSLQAIADLDKSGVTIAVQSGNTPDLFMRANFRNATLVELVTNSAANDIFPLVKAGSCNTALCTAAGYGGLHIDAAAGGRFGESSFVLTSYPAGRVLSPSLVLANIAPFIRPSLAGDASCYLADYLEAARASGLLQAIVDRLPFQKVGNVSCTNNNQCPMAGSIGEVCSAATNGKCGLSGSFGRSVPPARPRCPPAVKCQDVTVPADGSCHASTSINAGSSDADSDLAGCAQNPPGPYPEGTTPVTLTCSDTEGQTSSCTANVTVVDNTPPVVTTNPGDVNGFIASLWPPNHSYQTVSLSDCIEAALDQCDGTAVTSRIVGVTSDEPAGHGKEGDDILIADDGASVQLRAARDGSGDGRVYTIFATAADDDGNATQVTCQVQVPHDQSGAPAVDSGAAYCIGACN